MSACPASPQRTVRRRQHPEHRWARPVPQSPAQACRPARPADRPDIGCALAWLTVLVVALVVALAVGRLAVTAGHTLTGHLSGAQLAPTTVAPTVRP